MYLEFVDSFNSSLSYMFDFVNVEDCTAQLFFALIAKCEDLEYCISFSLFCCCCKVTALFGK